MTDRLRLALCVALLSPSLALAAPPDLPKRKSGLWELETQFPGEAKKSTLARQCIDEKTDDLLKQSAMAALNVKCSQNDWRREGDKLIFKSVCDIMGRKATTEGFFVGDFTSNYTGETNSTFDPPMHGMSSSSMSFKATWTGPCAPGQKAGEMILPGENGSPGMTINPGDVEKLREKMKQMRNPAQ